MKHKDKLSLYNNYYVPLFPTCEHEIESLLCTLNYEIEHKAILGLCQHIRVSNVANDYRLKVSIINLTACT